MSMSCHCLIQNNIILKSPLRCKFGEVILSMLQKPLVLVYILFKLKHVQSSLRVLDFFYDILKQPI